MKNTFLTGSFLRGYSGAYKYRKGYGKPDEQADAAWLEDRFEERSRRHRERNRSYLIGLQIATVIALLIGVGLTTLRIESSEGFEITMAEQETVDIQEIIQTAQQVLPPPPPRPPVPIVVADDEVLEDEALDLDASLDLTAAIAALPPPPAPVDEEPEDEPEFFTVVEEQPELIGGVAQLARAVQYPMIARQAGIEGMVVVQVIVTAQGQPASAQVVRSPSDVLNQAALDAVMKQRFKPGKQRGRAVPVQIAIPVRFQLTSGA